MNLESTIKQMYNVQPDDRLFISKRFYKKDSDSQFCVYIVHRTMCAVIEFENGANLYNPKFIEEIWTGDNNGRGEFAPIIRQWTGRNIKWPFEKGA